jgi:hypothetical protein
VVGLQGQFPIHKAIKKDAHQPSMRSVAIDFDSMWVKKLPAHKPGGLYKTSLQLYGAFVEATPSRIVRDGVGIFAA